jgi:hypothetical protein
MQSVSHHGIMGKIQDLNPQNLKEAMEDPKVDHVDVFEGTPEEIERRTKMIGKKYSVKKRFQKTGSNKNGKK